MKENTLGELEEVALKEQGTGGQAGIRGLCVVHMSLARAMCFFAHTGSFD